MRFLFLILLPVLARSQNLLVNGGFEAENVCIEYKVRCAPEAWIYSVPSFIYYFKDAATAYKGEHYVALIAGHANKPFYRTFVRTPLICGLRKGNTYRIELHVRSRHPLLDSLGIYFTPYDFLFEKKPYKELQPALYFTDALQKPARGDTGWQKVTLDYVATGTEAFLTLGNFSRRDMTGSTGIDRENNFFFLIDEVSMVPVNENENLCADWKNRVEEIRAQTERHEFQTRLVKENKMLPYQLIALPATRLTKVDTLVLPDVFFASNDAQINPKNREVLHEWVMQAHAKAIDSIVIEGHTDSTGAADFNLSLSQARAESVAGYLKQFLVAVPLFTRGWGSQKPAAGNSLPQDRQQNRRVEIYMYLREQAP